MNSFKTSNLCMHWAGCTTTRELGTLFMHEVIYNYGPFDNYIKKKLIEISKSTLIFTGLLESGAKTEVRCDLLRSKDTYNLIIFTSHTVSVTLSASSEDDSIK